MATIATMVQALDQASVRPLTADEVIRMVEAGILSEDEHVELLHGALWRKPVKSPEHAWIKGLLVDWLRTSGSYLVRSEDPIAVPNRTSLPEPDVAVVAPSIYQHAHPQHALLVIEIAVT